MEYLLKASGVIILFYLCYILFLQRETFFNTNRWFLMVGLVTSILFPLAVIPIYIEARPASLDDLSMITTSSAEASISYDASTIAMWIYTIGTIVFLGRLLIHLFSLIRLIKSSKGQRIDRCIHVRTSQDITPFSFFKWIVYNPNKFTAQELELILFHEKAHVNQLHSIDALLMEFSTVFLWFNPFIWLYGKALKQNLEFIADHHTQNLTNCDERYQKLLLKTSIPSQNHRLINTFYNSTIKKRILMLHKSKSNLMKIWKYSIIIPVLTIFALTFNIETIAQNSDPSLGSTFEDQQNILKFVVTMNTTDTQLNAIKNKLVEQGATIKFKNVKRNNQQKITGITIKMNYKNTTLNHSKKSSEPIDPIQIVLNPTKEHIDLATQQTKLTQSITIVNEADAMKTIDNKNREESVSSEDQTKSSSSFKSSIFILDGKEITEEQMNDLAPTSIESVEILKDESNTKEYGEKGKNGIIVITSKENKVISSDENRPLIIVEGKEVNTTKMDNIDPETIESVKVLKDASATKIYGDKGKNGVILIKLKKE